jgi:phosphoribosylaminoimidazole (AIR) synthetase
VYYIFYLASSHGPNVIGNIGGFAGMFKLDKKYNNPILVACTDGSIIFFILLHHMAPML